MDPHNILLIEDEPALSDLAALALNRQIKDCRVFIARDGLEALQLIEEVSPRTVILDLLLPQMNGLEFIRRLKARPTLQDTFVIVTSALAYPEVIRQAVAAGARDFIVKPYDVETLIQRVSTVIGQACPG